MCVCVWYIAKTTKNLGGGVWGGGGPKIYITNILESLCVWEGGLGCVCVCV